MDCNSSTARTVKVLRYNFYRFAEANFIKVHPSDMEQMMKDEKLLKFVLDSNGGDLDAALCALVEKYFEKMLIGVNSLSMKYNVKHDEKYSKAIKPVGTDNRGFRVLFVDLSELGDLDSSKDVVEHMFYWAERLKRQGNEKITLVLHHGKSKFVERNLNLVLLPLDTISRWFGSFKIPIFIFEDFLSNDSKLYLDEHLVDAFKLVDEFSWSCHFKLYEKYDLSDGYLKLVQKKPHNVEKCDKSTAALVKQCSEEVRWSKSEVFENIGDQKEQRIKLKLILAKLHDVENQVFQLIRDVQELI